MSFEIRVRGLPQRMGVALEAELDAAIRARVERLGLSYDEAFQQLVAAGLRCSGRPA